MTDLDEADHFLFRVGWAPSDVDDPVAILRNLRKQIEELEIEAQARDEELERAEVKLAERDERIGILERDLTKMSAIVAAVRREVTP